MPKQTDETLKIIFRAYAELSETRAVLQQHLDDQRDEKVNIGRSVEDAQRYTNTLALAALHVGFARRLVGAVDGPTHATETVEKILELSEEPLRRLEEIAVGHIQIGKSYPVGSSTPKISAGRLATDPDRWKRGVLELTVMDVIAGGDGLRFDGTETSLTPYPTMYQNACDAVQFFAPVGRVGANATPGTTPATPSV